MVKIWKGYEKDGEDIRKHFSCRSCLSVPKLLYSRVGLLESS